MSKIRKVTVSIFVANSKKVRELTIFFLSLAVVQLAAYDKLTTRKDADYGSVSLLR